MKILQIGLGSMGKRRIRNCLALGLKDIVGFDFREDRRQECKDKYKIKTIKKLTDAVLSERDILIISTPPDKHADYMRLAVRNKKPAFIEASVIREGLLELAMEAEEKKVFLAPSCTFRFHPAIKTVKDIVKSEKYGKVCNFMYHVGQYLPDWHPWEDIKDFYVSKRNTGACREIVPFEMTWMVDVFGFPAEVFAFYGKTINLGVDIDDTYSINLKYGPFIGNFLVDVAARCADRNLILNFEQGSLFWNWNEKVVKVFDAVTGQWIHYYEPKGSAHQGYNANIVEEMYIEEISTFFKAVKGDIKWPNSLRDDIKVLEILETMERTNAGAKYRSQV